MKTKSLVTFLFAFCFNAMHAQTPNWLWAHNHGGSQADGASSSVTDQLGNVYVAGWFSSPTITFGSFVLNNAGVIDMFVAKYDISGNVIWAHSGGGNGYDAANGISIDTTGNIFVTGSFDSPVATFGVNSLTNADNSGNTGDVFLIKYDSGGNVVWANRGGGTNNDVAFSVTTDISGKIYITGWFFSAVSTFGATNLINADNSTSTEDMFVVKYNSNGSVQWAKSAGGTNSDDGISVAADAAGNSYVAGWFNSTSLTFGSTTLTNAGGNDAYVVKYDVNGNILWAIREGGTGSDAINSIVSDASGIISVAGGYTSSSITIGSTILNNGGTQDFFLAKYNAIGSAVWAKSFGSSGFDFPSGIRLDSANNIYSTGSFKSDSIIFGATTLHNQNSIYYDLFLTKFDLNGNVLWAKSAGGMVDDKSYSVSVDPNGNSYVVGQFSSTSIVFDQDTVTALGNLDMFIAKNCVSGVSPIISGADTICSGENDTLIVSGGLTYLWNTGSTSTSIYVAPSNTSTYSVIATNSDGCSGNTTFLVSVNPTPAIPTISLSGAVLTSTSMTGNQWYLNNAIIPGATSQSYTPTQNGNYTVTVTNSFGCSSTSTVFAFTTLGTFENSTSAHYSLYPNPSNGNITIEFHDAIEKQVVVRVYDFEGRLLINQEFERRTNILQLNLSPLASGSYILSILVESNNPINTKLIINAAE